MPFRLAERLSEARRRRFVGRAEELAFFRSAIVADEAPFYVLHVYGPGGIGKTTLLSEFALVCDQAQIPAMQIDARYVDPSPESFLNALSSAMGLTPNGGPIEALMARGGRQVILIDTYEVLAPLDPWLREVFLPELPDNTLIVLAGRNLPPPAWRSDSGWQNLVQVLPLRNLSPDEGRLYLTRREVPAEQHESILEFTRGHPLALSLVADAFAQRPGFRFEPEAEPDIVKVLLEQFAQKVPGPAHRTALEACALVRLTTETLLAELLAMPDAHELFDWLRSLSFVESGRLGLFPHDLAREALVTDLRWRNPEWYAELHRRARTYYSNRLQQTRGQEQQRILFDYVFLHRDNPVVRPFLEWQETGTMLPDTLRESDCPAVIALVEQHEGPESAGIVAHWLERQPEGMLVFRDAEQQVVGFLAMVALHRATADDLRFDPAARVTARYLESRAPLRPGEGATLFRFWMARESYQNVSAIQSLIFINMVRHYLATPGLAYTFLPCINPDFWAPMFAYADLVRLTEADFEVGGRRYGVYGHDWRTVPPMAWLALLAEREIAMAPQTATAPPAVEPLVVLSEPAFAQAVRDALHDFTRADALRGSPLLRSRLVIERAGASSTPAERVAALQVLLKEAVELVGASPRDAKLQRVVHHTYLQPAATQELAAELLDLPFSTYRRHLMTALGRVVEILWDRELHGSGK